MCGGQSTIQCLVGQSPRTRIEEQITLVEGSYPIPEETPRSSSKHRGTPKEEKYHPFPPLKCSSYLRHMADARESLTHDTVPILNASVAWCAPSRVNKSGAPPRVTGMGTQESQEAENGEYGTGRLFIPT